MPLLKNKHPENGMDNHSLRPATTTPTWIFRYLLFISFIFLLNSTWAQSPGGTALPRKNIDDLTGPEMDAYLHAWTILKSRDKYDRSSFMWQAWVHNKPSVTLPDGKTAYPGMCEHGTSLFMPWHRAELYYLEQVLQQTDPEGRTGPSTKNVTIPYWNWLVKPSGRNLPKVFEDPNSVLYDTARFNELNEPLISRDLMAYQVYFMNWLNFGGGPAENPGFGQFEAQAHNPMHNAIGSNMSETTTAALDPVFYSFHCYIDQLYELWLTNHSADEVTNADYYLRGTQPTEVPKPAGYKAPRKGADRVMGQPLNYFDTRAVGYYYEIRPKDSLPPKEFIRRYTKNDMQFGAEAKSLQWKLIEHSKYRPSSDTGAVKKVTPIVIPEDSLRLAVITFTPDGDLGNTNYQVDLYLHPKGTIFTFKNNEFKERYLAGSIVYWGKGKKKMDHDMGMSMPMSSGVPFEIGDDINSLIATHRTADWTVTVIVTNLAPASAPKVTGKVTIKFSKK